MAYHENKMPVTWLLMTGFIHGWLEHELGGAMIGNRRLISVMRLKGAREILKMECGEDIDLDCGHVVNSISDERWNVYDAGLRVNAEVMEQEFGVTRDLLDQYVPIECPKMYLSAYGVLRPWTPNVCLERKQSSALIRLLREEFWRHVAAFDDEYSREPGRGRYPAAEMIEAFCASTGTAEMYVQDIRREWQRRVKRGDGRQSASHVATLEADGGDKGVET